MRRWAPVGWGALAVVGLASLVCQVWMACRGFFEAWWFWLYVAVVLAAVVWSTFRGRWTLREAALTLLPFVLVSLAFLPGVFYSVQGDPPQPRPYSTAVATATTYWLMACVPWSVGVCLFVGRLWMVPLALVPLVGWSALWALFAVNMALSGLPL